MGSLQDVLTACASLELGVIQTHEYEGTQQSKSYTSEAWTMPQLRVDLAASLIAVETDGFHFVVVDVAITNSTGVVSVENLGGTPRSVHRFSILNPTSFEVHSVHSPYIEQRELIFAAACTLANRRVLFGPINPIYLGAHYE